jgi:hypothetical protein
MHWKLLHSAGPVPTGGHGNATSEEGSNSRSLIEPISTLTTPENGNANRRQSEISIAGLPDGKEVPVLLSGISVVSSEVDSTARANPLSLHKRIPFVQFAKSAPCQNLDIDWLGAGRGSSELFEQRFCLSQIERVEAFSKPAEDRSQQFASLL